MFQQSATGLMNNTTFYRGQAYYIPAPNEICKKLNKNICKGSSHLTELMSIVGRVATDNGSTTLFKTQVLSTVGQRFSGPFQNVITLLVSTKCLDHEDHYRCH